MGNDHSYFARRAAEEHSAAEKAAGKARAAHEEMAERYGLLAQAAEAIGEGETEAEQDAPRAIG